MFGQYYDEGVSGGRSSLWPPDPTLEPEDEGVHLWGAQRDLYHRSAEDAEALQRFRQIRCGHGPGRKDHPFRGDEATGAGRDCRGSLALRNVLCESSVARWSADQSHDDPEVNSMPSRTGRNE